MHADKQITRLRNLLLAQGYICMLWNIEDVHEVRSDLTDAQCIEVLKRCQNRHDANIGSIGRLSAAMPTACSPRNSQPNTAPPEYRRGCTRFQL
jgi:hypothetical protein